MSAIKCALSEQITKEYFGDRVSKLLAFLATNGTSTLKDIIFKGKFPKSKAVADLQVLIQHNLVTFEESVEVKYTADLDFAVQRTRLFVFVEIGRRLHGEESELLLTEFVKHGRVKKEACIEEVLSKVQVDSEADFRETLSYTFDKLEQSQLIVKLKDQLVHTESSKKVEKENKGRKRVREESSDEEQAAQDDKKGCIWVLHTQRFNELLMHQHITQTLLLSQGEECALVMEKILHHSISTTSHLNTTTPGISFNELINVLRRSSGTTPSVLEQSLTILTKYESSFLTKIDESGGGLYKVDFKKAFKQLCINHVCCCIEEIYGTKAKSIFNMILTSVMIEEGEIEKKSRDPESVRAVLAKLRKDQYIYTMSFPKTSDFNSLNTIYLYKIDLVRVARLILERCYKAATNLITRRSHEIATNKRLLEIQSKLEVVLSQMEDDEQKEELQKTYISAAEQETLRRLRKSIDMLHNAEVQLDETTFVMETFLKICKLAP